MNTHLVQNTFSTSIAQMGTCSNFFNLINDFPVDLEGVSTMAKMSHTTFTNHMITFNSHALTSTLVIAI